MVRLFAVSLIHMYRLIKQELVYCKAFEDEIGVNNLNFCGGLDYDRSLKGPHLLDECYDFIH